MCWFQCCNYVEASVFLFDSHGRNNQGFHDPNGKATLLEFRSMTSLSNVLKTFFIENVSVSAETQCDLQYISVNVSDENKHQILDSLGRRRKSFYYRTYSESHTVIKEKKKKYSENIDFIREKLALYYNKYSCSGPPAFKSGSCRLRFSKLFLYYK